MNRRGAVSQPQLRMQQKQEAPTCYAAFLFA
jgi:hypothetical protein